MPRLVSWITHIRQFDEIREEFFRLQLRNNKSIKLRWRHFFLGRRRSGTGAATCGTLSIVHRGELPSQMTTTMSTTGNRPGVTEKAGVIIEMVTSPGVPQAKIAVFGEFQNANGHTDRHTLLYRCADAYKNKGMSNDRGQYGVSYLLRLRNLPVKPRVILDGDTVKADFSVFHRDEIEDVSIWIDETLRRHGHVIAVSVSGGKRRSGDGMRGRKPCETGRSAKDFSPASFAQEGLRSVEGRRVRTRVMMVIMMMRMVLMVTLRTRISIVEN